VGAFQEQMLMTLSHVTFAAHLILEDFGTILLQTLQPGISMGQVQIFGQASFGPLYIATVIDTTWQLFIDVAALEMLP
jgi:hypothetical protein